MPQRKCCVSFCSSKSLEGAILHAFPNPTTDYERFQKWVTNAGLDEEDVEYIYKNRRICHLHFETIYHYPSNRLNRLAIPTLQLSVPIEVVVELQQIDLHQPLLSQPELIRNSNSDKVLTEGSTCYNAVTNMMYHQEPQPSTSKQLGSNVATLFMDVLEPSASTKGNTAKKRIGKKSLSRVEISLYEKIVEIKTKLRKAEQSKAGLRQKLKLAQKFTLTESYKLVTKHLSPAAKIFFGMQIRQASKEPRGRRFSMDEKIMALSLYKPSPRAYRLLSQICVLPKKSTLNKLLANFTLSPGTNEAIFNYLNKKVAKMPASHKYCCIIFDEMAISPNLSYDKKIDKIKGLCDDGTNCINTIADHVLVFMVRGIFKKYKQPVSFTFCAGTTKTRNLKIQIKNVIEKVLEAGFKVVATVCDQGSTNMAAINSLITETRENYLRNGEEFRGGYFEVNNTRIYPLYDPPHLMKGIRNNLLRKDLEYTEDNRVKVAKWSHIEALYNRQPGYKGVRLLPKLTARHAIPHLIPKMKVKYCTQVFSRTVSVGMGITARYRRIPRESTNTADLLMFFDKLFDSVNGSFSKAIKGKIYRSAVKPKSAHFKLWHKSVPVLKSMRFLNSNGSGVVPSISSWIKTIEAFQKICKNLHSLGLTSLLLRNFNQDPLENFFGAIRAHGITNTMPSATAFEASYKTLIITNMVSPKSVGANCETDDCYCLENLKMLLNSNDPKPLPATPCVINVEDLNIILPNLSNMIASQNPADLEKCAAAAYCSGWIISCIYKLISKDCRACRKDLEGGSEEKY